MRCDNINDILDMAQFYPPVNTPLDNNYSYCGCFAARTKDQCNYYFQLIFVCSPSKNHIFTLSTTIFFAMLTLRV